MSEVWQDVFVTDSSLSQCIADIRRAIGDSDRQILQTVPKRGYILRAMDIGKSALPYQDGSSKKEVDGRRFINHSNLFGKPHVWIARHDTSGLESGSQGHEWRAILDGSSQSDSPQPAGKILRERPNSVLVEFDDVRSALRCALGLCLLPGPGLAGGMPRYRIGVDLKRSGQQVAPPGGDSDMVAAEHLGALALPGQIIVSGEVRDAAVSDVDCGFEWLGERHFPGIVQSVRVFQAQPTGPPSQSRFVAVAEDLLPTIAIIPFTPHGVASDHEVIGDIIADDINAELSRSQEANIISRLSTTMFRSKSADLGQIGSRLSADFVLSGRFRGDAARIVVNLEFAEVGSDRMLWSDRFEESVKSLLEEAETARQVVSRIRKSIVLNELRRVRISPLSSLRSYSLLIGAVAMMHRLSPPDFEAARVMLASLIHRWPNHPSPLAWMARWHVLRVQQGWSPAPQDDAHAAMECSGRALDIDPDHSLALVSEGSVLNNLMRRLDEAEDRFNMALDVNPNDAVGRLLRGTLYAFQGKGVEAIRDSERALLLAPLDPHRFHYLAHAAGAHLAAGDCARALELANRSLQTNRTHASTFRIKAVAQMLLGQEAEARATAQELLRLQPGLRVSTWLRDSPSADFAVGRRFAQALRAAGIPD